MTPPTRGFRVMRNATLSLALKHDFVRPLFHWRTSRAHVYADSTLNASAEPGGASAEAAIGAVMPNARLDDGTYLLDYLTPQYHVVVHGGNGNGDDLAPLRELQAGLKKQGVELGMLVVQHGAAPGVLADSAGNFGKAAWAATGNGPRVFLVRPDQHIAGCWSSPDQQCVEHIQRAMNALFCRD